ncbi:hypothetical protein GSI_04938 [Ganoderma sinense ZZ0214-1]|uniref:Uncharacterized protein n=1 Tax=Ganoderma sinense ZZ0214-1 TaxID=1077348 RepID=A0A2G8SGE5_9APHY|nr:hypothetical protein GSI_04938 [Ganoderma sinense ZZ0214-1]
MLSSPSPLADIVHLHLLSLSPSPDLGCSSCAPPPRLYRARAEKGSIRPTLSPAFRACHALMFARTPGSVPCLHPLVLGPRYPGCEVARQLLYGHHAAPGSSCCICASLWSTLLASFTWSSRPGSRAESIPLSPSLLPIVHDTFDTLYAPGPTSGVNISTVLGWDRGSFPLICGHPLRLGSVHYS